MTTSVSSTSTTAATTGYSSLQASDSGTGIDYSALVEAAVAKRLAPADRIDQTISENEARITAYTEMQDLLQAVTESLEGLRNRTASTGADSNLFDQRTAYLSGGDDLLSVTAEDGAETGTYAIEVKQIATRHKIGADATGSQSAALGQSGSFTLGVEDGSAVTIEVDADDTLADIRDAINAQKSTSGVTASIVKVTDSEYQLILTATDTGKAIELTDANSSGGGGVLSGLGLTDADGAIANELVAAQDAVVVIDGVEITRNSNTIDDAVDGLTLDLYAASEGETITAEVSTDLSAIKEALLAFVDAYNAFRSFASSQQEVASDGSKSEDATLFADSLLRQVSKSVYAALTDTVTADDGSVMSLATLGITFDSSNNLTVDETALNTALTEDIEAVKTLLGLDVSSSSEDLKLLRYDSTLSAASITLDIAVAEDGSLTSATVGGDSSLFRVDGNRIIGNDGTAYAGVVLVYTGESASVDVSFSQGLADQLYSALAEVADDDSGSIASLVDQLEDTNSDLETKSDTIKARADDYRTRLTAYYARLEAAAEAANLLLQQLQYNEDDDS